MRKLVKDRDKLAIASAIWTDDWWYPDSSIDVNPPLVTSRSSTIPKQSQAIVVGKQALLTCLKYTKNPSKIQEPLSDIWETIEETESDNEEDLEKRHLIGNVVKASDGSFQLFADHRSHIGRNQVGCCGRKFSNTTPKIPEKRKNLNIRAKWKAIVGKINAERKKHLISERIAGKTYSTYAIQHKFRKRYASLKIGVQEKTKKRKEIHVNVPIFGKLPKKEPLPARKVSLVKPQFNLKNVVLRVASSIDMDDFEPSEEEEEEEEEEEYEEEKKKKEKRKKNRKFRDSKWYGDFVNFQSKRKEIERLLKDNSRRGSILPPQSEYTMRSGGIWATATEEDLAKIVVNTLMEAKEGYRKSPVLSHVSENLSLRKQQHEESVETEPAPELKGKQRTLSTSEEIKVQRESIAKEMEKHQKKKEKQQQSKTKKKPRKKSIVKDSLQKSTDSSTTANTDDNVFEQGGNVGHQKSKKKLKGAVGKVIEKKTKDEKKKKEVKGKSKASAENQRKDSTKSGPKKKEETPSKEEIELKKKKLSEMYGRTKKTKVVKKEKKKDNIQCTQDLFAHLGKANVERAVKELCLANPKWAKVVSNHNRIQSRGITLDFDTLLKGMLLPMDYNNLIRQAIKKLEAAAKSSRKPSFNPLNNTVIDVEK